MGKLIHEGGKVTQRPKPKAKRSRRTTTKPAAKKRRGGK